MLPLERLQAAEAQRLRGLLFDLDDTFLDRGALTEAAYAALHRLVRSGLVAVAVTGRPAGWGQLLARQWPVAGVVSENGAIAFVGKASEVERVDVVPGEERVRRRARLQAVVGEIQAAFPELRPADDVDARVSDFTFDIGERHRLPRELVERASEFVRQRGARVLVSSVHLHVTFEGDDKASGAVRLLRVLTGVDATAARARFAFIGDSQNDESCFAAFHTTIAVANLSGRPTVAPRFVTQGAASAGFVEATELLLKLRGDKSVV